RAGRAAQSRANSRALRPPRRYVPRFWNALNEGFFAPLAVIRPDCQPFGFGSSRSRNQSIMSIRGFFRASVKACVRYAACFAYETPKSLSGGLVSYPYSVIQIRLLP